MDVLIPGVFAGILLIPKDRQVFERAWQTRLRWIGPEGVSGCIGRETLPLKFRITIWRVISGKDDRNFPARVILGLPPRNIAASYL